MRPSRRRRMLAGGRMSLSYLSLATQGSGGGLEHGVRSGRLSFGRLPQAAVQLGVSLRASGGAGLYGRDLRHFALRQRRRKVVVAVAITPALTGDDGFWD